MALIPEPWWLLIGLNIPGYTLFFKSKRDIPIACTLVRNMNIKMLTGFSSRDLVAVPINYNEGRKMFDCLLCLLP